MSDAGGESEGTTVFVRNLAFDVTNEQLETHFGDIAPVRRAFVVTQQDGKARGFGFVQYGTADDANEAVKSLNGSDLQGRALKLEIAAKKGGDKKDKSKAKKKTQTEADDGEPTGEAADAEDAATDKKAKKKKKRDVTDEEGTAAEEEAAADLVPEKPAAKKRKKDAKEVAAEVKPTEPVKSTEPKGPRSIIISGLPEGVTKAQIKHKVKKMGAVEEIDYPNENGEAIVLFKDTKASSKAVIKLHEHIFKGASLMVHLVKDPNPKAGRLIVRNLSFKVTLDSLRETFEKCGAIAELKIPKKPDGTKRGFAFVQFERKIDAGKAIKQLNETKLFERPIAVDWALSQADFKAQMAAQEKAAAKEEEEESEEEEEEEEGEDEEGEDEEGEEEEDAEEEEDDEDEEDEEEDEDEEEEDEDEKKAATAKKGEQLGRSVFVRNIPFRCDKDDLHRALRRFGKIKSCVIVMDAKTGMSQGKGFVQFAEQEAALSALEAAESVVPIELRVEGMEYPGSVTLEDRALMLAPAVDRDKAKTLVSQKLDGKKKMTGEESGGKRNLHLAQEGMISEDMDAAKDISATDMEKRSAAAVDKRRKLSDPNNFVSSTRLSVRNLPTSTDEKELRNLVLEMAGKKAAVKQVKMVRDPARKDRSKGYGFIEMTKHQDALTLLRALNNNPDTAGGKNKRPIVEFAVENVLKLRRLQQSMKGGATATAKEGDKPSKRERKEARMKEREEHEAAEAERPKSRRELQALADKEKSQGDRAKEDDGDDAAPKRRDVEHERRQRHADRHGRTDITKHVTDVETNKLAAPSDAVKQGGKKRSRQQRKEVEVVKESAFDKMIAGYKKTLS